jgi:ADP-ribose pyrophosphatase YjhB (NUDIX family)
MEQLQTEISRIFGNKVRIRVCGICIQDEKLLLIRHKGIGKKGFLWAPPGGGLDFGESVETTLKREFLEETGLEIEMGNFMFINEYICSPLHAIELFFEVKIVGGKLQAGSDPEMTQEMQMIEDLKFMSLSETRSYHPDTLHQLFQHINSLQELMLLKGFCPQKNTIATSSI